MVVLNQESLMLFLRFDAPRLLLALGVRMVRADTSAAGRFIPSPSHALDGDIAGFLEVVLKRNGTMSTFMFCLSRLFTRVMNRSLTISTISPGPESRVNVMTGARHPLKHLGFNRHLILSRLRLVRKKYGWSGPAGTSKSRHMQHLQDLAVQQGDLSEAICRLEESLPTYL